MCDSLSTPRPLGPLRDVADELGPSVSALLRGTAAQHEIFAAVLDALRARPRVFVVEDLHWADEATLDLVRYLARRIAGLPLLLVLSYRDAVGVDHPLSPVLGDLVASPGARRAAADPAEPVGRRRARRRARARPGRRPPPDRGQPVLPQPDPRPAGRPDARERPGRRARPDRRVGPPVRHCLELLSCTPEPVGPELLDALGVSTATVGVLATTGLIDRHGRGVAFRHEIARSAILGAAVPGSEAALHGAMIDALETVGADPSVLAHHAAAAGDVARVLRYAPAAAAEASRSGAHREAVAFYEAALRHVGDDTTTRADLLEAMSLDLYLTDRLRDAITARERALELRRGMGEIVAVGAAHTALSGFAWYAADRGSAVRHAEAAIEILSTTDDRRALGFALARHIFLAALGRRHAEARRSGDRAARIADELGGDIVLRSTASIGVAVARLLDGDLGGRADLLAATDVGLRHRLDNLATTPMSNLCHYDVEQGRFAEAEESVAEALRISEERDTPSCTAFQLGVRARLRLLQGRLAEAEDDARAVLSSADVPLGQLWPHLVLGMLVARRDGSPANPHLDELWRLVNKLDNPGMVAAVAAALAENAWITRRPDARLDDPLVTGLFTREWAGREAALAALRRWSRRLAEAGIQQVDPALPDRAGPAAGAGEPVLRAGDGAVGRGGDRRPAGRAPGARRPRRPGGRRPVPRPAARRGREQRPPGPVGRHPGQPGRADRPPARRAGPAGRRPEQRRHRRAPGHLAQDRRPPRVGDPGQAGRPHPRRRGGRRPPPRRRCAAAELGVRAPARSFEALVDDDAQVHAEGDADRVAGDVGGPVEVGHHLAEGHDRHHGVDGAEPGRRALAAAGRQRDADLPHGHFENDQHGDEHGLQVCLHRLLLESEGAVAAAAAVSPACGR